MVNLWPIMEMRFARLDTEPYTGFWLDYLWHWLKIDIAEKSVDASASLVYLKHMQKNGVKELETESITDNGIMEVLKDSFRKIKHEEFTAKVSPLCRYCQFARMCPAQPEGKGIVQ